MEKNKDEDKAPAGASALLGLFSTDDSRDIAAGATASRSTNDDQALNTVSSFEDTVKSPTAEQRYDNFASPSGGDDESGAGSNAHLMALFAAPNNSKPPLIPTLQNKPKAGVMPDLLLKPDTVRREKTVTRSNKASSQWTTTEEMPLLQGQTASFCQHQTFDNSSQISQPGHQSILKGPSSHSIRSVFSAGGDDSLRPTHVRLPSVAMPPINERRASLVVTPSTGSDQGRFSAFREQCWNLLQDFTTGTTYVGASMYLFFHVVFCLALGSSIIRPHSQTSILGLMTKTAAIGTIASSSVYWWTLSSEVPALYPTADLFLAPFLANLAQQIDNVLSKDESIHPDDNDSIFLATFGVLSGIGILLSGSLLMLSGVFRLTDLASFLPFEVISGFFSAVGILTWTLAVTIDSGGLTAGKIIASADPEQLKLVAMHHFPSIIIAAIMKYLGPKNPFYVILVVVVAIAMFYAALFATGTSMDEARDQGWFWTHSELVYDKTTTLGFAEWSPPAPFGVLNQLFHGRVHWQAVKEGLGTASALGFLYLIRCSVHGAALKKNIPNLVRKVSVNSKQENREEIVKSPRMTVPARARNRTFSEAVDIEAVLKPFSMSMRVVADEGSSIAEIRAQPTNISLKSILGPYGVSQIVGALVGGFAVTPSVAASSTMFSLGADRVAPQVGSVLLLFVFYLTDFQLVSYIPKPAFSSMLVLAFMDMIYTWFYKSYFKTENKSEWLVVPTIVFCAFMFDLLSAVFLGIAFSTFIFVAAFFRSGVVKFVANASVIHSTIERPFRRVQYLVENGDFIQIMVLQNYLFFGNSSSVYSFILAMFQRTETQEVDDTVTRKPKYLILDLTLVSGLDTSAVDVFNEIRNLCTSNECKLFVTGLSPSLRGVLALGGFKPETIERSKRKLRFFASLDAALGKAEDLLLRADLDTRDARLMDGRARLLSEGDFGFRTALRRIDEEHGDNFTLGLVALQPFTTLVELNAGDLLYGDTETHKMPERGLFFIESGLLKIEHNAANTMTRGKTQSSIGVSSKFPTTDSLTKIQALEYANIVQASQREPTAFRSARIGPGWIAGAAEAVSGEPRHGQVVAVTGCLLHHLSFAQLEEIEKENPTLVLNLYKLLAYMMARRQEATIGQLATLHSIMTSPATRI